MNIAEFRPPAHRPDHRKTETEERIRPEIAGARILWIQNPTFPPIQKPRNPTTQTSAPTQIGDSAPTQRSDPSRSDPDCCYPRNERPRSICLVLHPNRKYRPIHRRPDPCEQVRQPLPIKKRINNNIHYCFSRTKELYYIYKV